MITIDSEKCIGCLQCVSVCPFRVLDAEEGKPVVSRGHLCIKCLHCAAACPENAVHLGELDGILTEELPDLPGNAYDQIRKQLMTRRSYRHFKPETVPKEILTDALRIAAWSPSAKNQHPTKWIVISDEGKTKKLWITSLIT